jgi:hypothetical protein
MAQTAWRYSAADGKGEAALFEWLERIRSHPTLNADGRMYHRLLTEVVSVNAAVFARERARVVKQVATRQ